MKKIGKGTFTTAYLRDDGSVKLVSCDPIKECMSMGWFPESRLFPAVTQIGNEWYGDKKAYTMEFLDHPRSLKNSLCEHDWELYKILRKLWVPYQDNPNLYFEKWHKAFDTIPDKFSDERDALHEALDGCANYGCDICFEISPRNVAVKGSQLILLDCFFVNSKLYC